MHEMNWKAMATQAYDRGDPFEIAMMAAAAKVCAAMLLIAHASAAAATTVVSKGCS